MSQACGCLLRNTADNHARVTVADQNHIVQIFVEEHTENILDMGVEADTWP